MSQMTLRWQQYGAGIDDADDTTLVHPSVSTNSILDNLKMLCKLSYSTFRWSTWSFQHIFEYYNRVFETNINFVGLEADNIEIS